MIEDQNSPAEKLSIETLSNILQHLTTSDRKHARLVNSKWYQASKNPICQQDQKFVLDGLTHKLQLGSVFEVLQNGNYQYYNLEFLNEDFHLSLIEFVLFIKCNSMHIRSLTFVFCQFSFTLIEEIVMNCVNLEELVFRHCQCDNFEETKLISNSKMVIIRQQPIFLEMYNVSWMTRRMLEILLNVYQNVKRIRIFREYFAKFTVNINVNLEPWRLFFLANCFDDVFFQELKKSYPRITLEEVGFPEDDLFDLWYNEYSFVDFLKTHNKDLKSFDTMSDYFFSLECLEKLLFYCPNLEILFLRECMHYYFRDSEKNVQKVLELVAKSKLKALAIENFLVPREDVIFPKFERNANLHYLDINFRYTRRPKAVGNTFLMTILKTFRNLIYLNLSHTDVQGSRKEVVKKLFQDQLHLRYLKLNGCPWVSDRVFKRCSLTKLEHLELKNARITHAAFRHFNFPKLKFLRLSSCEKISDRNFTKISQECPLLRYLDVSYTRIGEKSVLNLCQKLNFLHCVDIKRSKNSLVLNLETLHQCCPTLRFVQMGNEDLYAYNHLEKIWNEKKWNKYENEENYCMRCQPSEEQLMNLSS